MESFHTGDFQVFYRRDKDIENEVTTKVIEFFKEHGAYHPETIYQSDNVLLNAPDLLCELVKIFDFIVYDG